MLDKTAFWVSTWEWAEEKCVGVTPSSEAATVTVGVAVAIVGVDLLAALSRSCFRRSSDALPAATLLELVSLSPQWR